MSRCPVALVVTLDAALVSSTRSLSLATCAGNGRSKPICVKNMSVEEVQEQVDWLRNSHGRGQEYKVVRIRQLSRNPSIQGAWSIDTFASQLREANALKLQDAATQQQY